jgi:hypothetical protein
MILFEGKMNAKILVINLEFTIGFIIQAVIG